MTEELEKQNTVGLLNFHFANNYGAVLVAWSLKKSIEALGWKTEIIDFNGDNVVTNPAFEHFQKRFLQPRTREFKTVEELEKVGDHWERIVVGSDQVFRLHKTQAYMLSWAYGNCLLTAYAASFGRDDYCSPMPIADAFSMLKRFDNLSVRESSGVDVCSELFDVQAEHVLDPTLLLDAADYDEIIDSEEHVLPETPYIAVMFYNRSGKEKFESLLADHDYKYDVKSNTYTPPQHTSNAETFCKGYRVLNLNTVADGKRRTVSDWLFCIKHADFVLTDSFHAAVFAIIFNKNFRITCYNAWNGPARLESLLAMFELDGSRIRPFNEEFFHFPSPQDACIDYTELAAIRERLKEKSLNYLRTSLSKRPTFKKKWHKPTLQDLLCNLDKATDACSFGDEHRFHIRWAILHAHDLEMTVNEQERNQRLSLEKSIHRIEEKVKVLKQNQQSTRFLKKQLKSLLKQNIKAVLKRCLPSLLHSPLKKSWFLTKVICKKVMNKR